MVVSSHRLFIPTSFLKPSVEQQPRKLGKCVPRPGQKSPGSRRGLANAAATRSIRMRFAASILPADPSFSISRSLQDAAYAGLNNVLWMKIFPAAQGVRQAVHVRDFTVDVVRILVALAVSNT